MQIDTVSFGLLPLSLPKYIFTISFIAYCYILESDFIYHTIPTYFNSGLKSNLLNK